MGACPRLESLLLVTGSSEFKIQFDDYRER